MSAQQHGSWVDDDDDEPETEDQRGNDSSAMRELRKADRAKAKRIAELESQLASLTGAERSRTVKEVLQARNLDPKIATLIPSDVEATEDAVGKWLDEYGDVFGRPQERTLSDKEEQAVLAQMRQVDSLTDGLRIPPEVSDLSARINAVQTREELDALIFGGGAAGR